MSRKKKAIIEMTVLLCCCVAVLFVNLSGKARASMPDFDTSLFKGVNTLAISVGPVPWSKDYPFPVTQEVLMSTVLGHFKEKFAGQPGRMKVVDREIWNSARHSDDDYNAALNLRIYISWRAVEGFGKDEKLDIAAVGVKIMRYKKYSGEPHGRSSTQVGDAIPALFLISEDKTVFKKTVLDAIDQTTNWIIPWLTCQDDGNLDGCRKRKSRYVE